MNVSSLRHFTREESRKLSDMMMAFAHSPQCAGPMSSAISEIFGDLGSLTDDVRTAAETESCQSVFHTWFLFDRAIVKDGQTLIDVFSGNDALGLTRGQLRYLERMRPSHLRPYEVREVHRDVALVLQDIWNGEVVNIHERIATWYAEPGSSIFARVVEGPEGHPEMHGVLSFPRDWMDDLVKSLRRVYDATREHCPESSDAAFFKDVTPWIMRSWLDSFRPPRRTSSRAGKMPTRKRVLQLRIALEGVRPQVWRRLLVADTMKLDALSRALERVMGWESYHLHEFEIDGITYGTPDLEYPQDVRNESGRRLCDFAWKKGSSFLYRYDFGDGWRHRVRVESIGDPEPGVKYPRCVAGESACPPEDVGGAGGYSDFLKALRNPKHKDHERFREWARRSRRDFDPHAFELDAVNKRLGAHPKTI